MPLLERSERELFESLMRLEVFVGRPSSFQATIQKTAAKVGVNGKFVRHKFLNVLPANINNPFTVTALKNK